MGMMRIFCKLMLFLTLCWVTSASAATVAGKVTTDGGKTPTAGVRVLAYPLGAVSLGGEAPHRSAATGKDGLFSLELPAGQYFFLARGGGFFAYYGRNPVAVPEAGLAGMNLALVAEDPALIEQKTEISTGVTGRALVGEKPLADAIVYVYTDLNDQLKGMGLGMSAPTDEKGRFEVPLAPGTYYLLARKRQAGGFAGPLRAGDFIGYYPGNPVTVGPDRVVQLTLPMLEVPEKVERLADSLFGQTSIHGRIVDGEGKPVAGARAILYSDPTMLNRPLYVSRPSDADGRFVLSFAEGGTYFLAARDTLGGTPQPGERYGRFAGSGDGSIQVVTGQDKSGVEIVVEEMW
jgi:hypothetical protein